MNSRRGNKMKSLVESIFGDNIKNDINISELDINVACDIIVDSLENKLKIKCADDSNLYLNKSLWSDGWHLIKTEFDLLMENLTIRYCENYKGLFISFDLVIQFSRSRRDNPIYVYDIDVSIRENYKDFVSTGIRGWMTIERYTKLKDASFNSNFKGIIKYVTDSFSEFKNLVDNDKAFETLKEKCYEHYYAKRTEKGNIEDDAIAILKKSIENIMEA